MNRATWMVGIVVCAFLAIDQPLFAQGSIPSTVKSSEKEILVLPEPPAIRNRTVEMWDATYTLKEVDFDIVRFLNGLGGKSESGPGFKSDAQFIPGERLTINIIENSGPLNNIKLRTSRESIIQIDDDPPKARKFAKSFQIKPGTTQLFASDVQGRVEARDLTSDQAAKTGTCLLNFYGDSVADDVLPRLFDSVANAAYAVAVIASGTTICTITRRAHSTSLAAQVAARRYTSYLTIEGSEPGKTLLCIDLDEEGMSEDPQSSVTNHYSFPNEIASPSRLPFATKPATSLADVIIPSHSDSPIAFSEIPQRSAASQGIWPLRI